MLFIKESEKADIRSRIKSMPPIFKNQNAVICLFECLGTFVLAYGICVSQYQHPIKNGEPNPYWTFLISCFLYFAISISAPFTGGHCNPSVTVGTTVAGICNRHKILLYIGSQLVGAFLGVFLCKNMSHIQIKWLQACLKQPCLQPYTPALQNSKISCWTEWDRHSEPSSSCSASSMPSRETTCRAPTSNTSSSSWCCWWAARTYQHNFRFSFRQGCLNPAVGIALQIFSAYHHNDAVLFFDVFGVVVGSIVGGTAAAVYYNSFFDPLMKEMENNSWLICFQLAAMLNIYGCVSYYG